MGPLPQTVRRDRPGLRLVCVPRMSTKKGRVAANHGAKCAAGLGQWARLCEPLTNVGRTVPCRAYPSTALMALNSVRSILIFPSCGSPKRARQFRRLYAAVVAAWELPGSSLWVYTHPAVKPR